MSTMTALRNPEHTSTAQRRELLALWAAWAVLIVTALIPVPGFGLIALAIAMVLPGYLIETRLIHMGQLEIVQRAGLWVVFSFMTWILVALPTILFARHMYWLADLAVVLLGTALAITFAPVRARD